MGKKGRRWCVHQIHIHICILIYLFIFLRYSTIVRRSPKE